MTQDVGLAVLENVLVAAVVVFELVVGADKGIGTRTADLGQVVARLVLARLTLAADEAHKRTEEGDGTGDDSGGDLGAQPNKGKGCAVCEVCVASDKADGRGFVDANNAGTSLVSELIS